MNRIILSLAACATLLAACGDAPPEPVASFDDVYAGAAEALSKAQAMRNVWTPTERLLRDSRAAHDEGRIEDAIALAAEARLQAELAIEQAEHEKDAWRSRVLTD